MGIPVSLPSGPLVITDAQNASAETLLAALIQVIASGTSGAAITTPPTTIPSPTAPAPATIPLQITTAEQQLIFRQIALAIATVLSSSGVPDASSTVKGVTKLSSNPSVSTNPIALNAQEVATVSSANAVVRALSSGKIDPSWLPSSSNSGYDVQFLLFNFATISPLVLQAVTPGLILNLAQVLVITPFNNGGATMTLGTTANPSLVFDSTDVTLQSVGQYETDYLIQFAASDVLELFINPSGSTQGSGLLLYQTVS